MTSETVPFGKYKGMPVEDMLADAEYMRWLEAQPWFRERYSSLLSRRDAEAASRTPVHNRLQALFLNSRYAEAFVRSVSTARLSALECALLGEIGPLASKLEKDADEAESKASGFDRSISWQATRVDGLLSERDRYRSRAARIRGQQPALELEVAFEAAGADVLIRGGLKGILEHGEGFLSFYGSGKELEASREPGVWPIEIKPTVADEYPAVLRQMGRNRSRYLFVGRYCGEGASEAEFVAIFAASGKTVVFKRDVDALVASLEGGGA